MRLRVALLAGGLLSLATMLWAHDLFLKLDSYFLEPGVTARVPVLNGTFAKSQNSVIARRVAAITLVSPERRAELDTTAWSVKGDTSYVTIRVSSAGTYVLGASVRPNTLSMTAAEFNAYLEEDGITDMVETRRRKGELERPARERYSKHVKAIFQVGDRVGDDYEAVLGYPAEIVPLANPYGLKVGDELAVRCLVDGKPVQVTVLAGGEGAAGPIAQRSVRSGADGVARVSIVAAGRWYVKFVHMVEVSEAELDYESNWATMTFAVR